ncbi:MAG: hypothetical protein KAI43_01835 [Candidatus Aureabacteria bacterium]|nr:hypothetical protein [Candidatus Auribacterota bacterium]
MNIKTLIKNLKKFLWILYFLFLLTIALWELFVFRSPEALLDFAISLPAKVGLLIFIFRLRILVVEYWRLYLFVFLAWSLYWNIVMRWVYYPLDVLSVFKFVLMLFPLYFALYKIAFSRKSPLI